MEKVIEVKPGIFEFDSPKTIETGAWANEHLDCNAIIDFNGNTIVVYAFTQDPKYNSLLGVFKQEKYNTKKILRGISSNGLRGLY